MSANKPADAETSAATRGSPLDRAGEIFVIVLAVAAVTAVLLLPVESLMTDLVYRAF